MSIGLIFLIVMLFYIFIAIIYITWEKESNYMCMCEQTHIYTICIKYRGKKEIQQIEQT